MDIVETGTYSGSPWSAGQPGTSQPGQWSGYHGAFHPTQSGQPPKVPQTTEGEPDRKRKRDDTPIVISPKSPGEYNVM